jgi:uncharacterized damage-inducible protein DinB
MPEPWLSGPVPGIITDLQPAAHMLLDARADLQRVVSPLPEALIWERPGGAASIGFHLLHAAGSIDRLLTYAVGQPLSDAQREALAAEKDPASLGRPGPQLLAGILATIDRALDVLKQTSGEELDTPRAVGRQMLPSSVRGLLFHVAEHTQRHAGQVVTTAKVVGGR